jgi:hypothetical protein
MDNEIEELSRQLEILATACLDHLALKRADLTAEQRLKLRRVARAALNRAHELPRLVMEDREAWIERTLKFMDAAARFLTELVYLDYGEQ